MDILLLDRLLLIGELFERDMDRAFDSTALSKARMRVLWVVHHGGPATQQSLAQQLDVTARNISGLIDALEGAGYVERTAHPTDRRATLVKLTPTGAELMVQTARSHKELNDTLLAAVDAADRAGLERGIDAIATLLGNLVAEAETEAHMDQT